MTQPRTAAPASLYAGLFGVTGENGAPGVAAGPCHTDDCTGLHWTDADAEYHLFGDRTMQAVDPAEWLDRHPEARFDAKVPLPRTVLAYLNGPAAPGGPLPAQPTRCTDPDCVDFGKAVSPVHGTAGVYCIDPRCPDFNTPEEPGGRCPTGPKVADDEFVAGDRDAGFDDPWAGHPVARATFRQRWLSGPKFIRRWHLPRTNYFDAVLTVDLRSWAVGVEVWPHRRGGWLQVGPARITIDEPPF